MITFLFDHRSLALWTLTLVGAGVLLFLGGVVVGVHLNLPPQVQPATRGSVPLPRPAPEPPVPSSGPVSPASPTTPVRTAALAASSPAVREDVPLPPPRSPSAAFAALDRPLKPPKAPEAEDGYSVQLGAFRSEDNAVQLQRELDLEGLETYLFVDRTPGHGALFTVRAGRYVSRHEAAVAAADLAARSGRDTWVPPPGR